LFLLICFGVPPVNLAAHKSAPVSEYRRLVYDVIVLIRKQTAYSDWHEAAQYRVQTIGVWHQYWLESIFFILFFLFWNNILM